MDVSKRKGKEKIMTIQKLYEKFQECKTVEDFQEVMVILADMSAMENAKEAKQGSRLRASLQVLKTSKKRPILSKAVIIDGKQVFTNSYVAFQIEDKIAGLPTHETNEKFPDVLRFFEKGSNEARFNVGEVKADIGRIGKEKNIDLALKPNEYVRLDKKYLMQVIQILGFKNNEVITFRYNKDDLDSKYIRKTLFVERNNDKAIILPILVK